MPTICINCELNSYQNELPQFEVKQTAHVTCFKKYTICLIELIIQKWH